ncbi:MAG: hypothetical protein COW56_02375 [Rhodocyclales bacterium CG17_big_fil_post_rev_8_21_14_2_50_68_7]|nr:MAG: hypothetical protein COW56_02375 [Rhodocyclales bacterium CG17_big_fil_post_rev_8_21_14_2_50_68_7]
MMNKTILSGLAASLLVVSSVALAGVNARQHHQQQRIEQGWRSGELTRGEARRLGGEQRMIRREERAYRTDGVLSPRERRDLNRDLNRASRHIYREKHDAQERRPGTGTPGVDRREANERARIGQGVRSGELTRDETRALAAEQRNIRQEERAYKSDGIVTREERKDLHQDLNAASRHIYEEKHDGETRNTP